MRPAPRGTDAAASGSSSDPAAISSEPPPMSNSRICPAAQPNQRRTARNVKRASVSPPSTCSGCPSAASMPRDHLGAVGRLAHRGGRRREQLVDALGSGGLGGLADRPLERAHALFADRAVGAEVAHEAQHGAPARRRERPAAWTDVRDQQMDGVRTDIEDSEAHALRVAGGIRYDGRDVRRRRPLTAPPPSLVPRDRPRRLVASRLRHGAAADRDRDRPAPRARRPALHGRGRARCTCPCRGCCRSTRSHDQAPGRIHEHVPARADSTTPSWWASPGSVAVGKSTIARLLRELMSRWSDTPRVERVTTDGSSTPMPSSSGGG